MVSKKLKITAWWPPWCVDMMLNENCCPNCGWNDFSYDIPQPELISQTDRYYVYAGEYSCFEWDETYECPDCGQRFTITTND